MATVRLPTVLRGLAGGERAIPVAAKTLDELATELRDRYPQLAARLYAGDGAFARFVNVFVDGEDVRLLGTAARLADGSSVEVLPAVSGG